MCHRHEVRQMTLNNQPTTYPGS